MQSSDPNFAAAADDFKKGGWIVAILGAAGMLASIMLRDKSYPIKIILKKMFGGGIVGVICYFALHGQDIDPLYKAVICAASGCVAPELINLAKKTVNNYGKKRSK
jgi:hypothetical protein